MDEGRNRGRDVRRVTESWQVMPRLGPALSASLHREDAHRSARHTGGGRKQAPRAKLEEAGEAGPSHELSRPPPAPRPPCGPRTRLQPQKALLLLSPPSLTRQVPAVGLAAG